MEEHIYEHSNNVERVLKKVNSEEKESGIGSKTMNNKRSLTSSW